MKTSNKLLIAFGAFLFIAPLLGMVIISKVFYKDASNLNMAEIQEVNNQPFSTVSKGRKTIVLDKAFSSINFLDGNNSSIEVHFIKSKSYGIKIPEEVVGSIKEEVINGELNISFNKEFSKPDFRQRIYLVVYAPNLEKLTANNFINLSCVVQTDSLVVNVARCYFSLGNSDIKLTSMNNKGDTLNHSVSNQTNIESLKIISDKSNINISELNLHSLNILANNDSEINLEGRKINQGQSEIKNFSIETSGKNQVSIKNFNFSKTKSNFSDDTQLTIPTSILKMLLKD